MNTAVRLAYGFCSAITAAGKLTVAGA